MTIDHAIAFLTSLVSVTVAILLAAIPWAYGIHGRLTRIESTLAEHLPGQRQLTELNTRLTRLELAAERKNEATV